MTSNLLIIVLVGVVGSWSSSQQFWDVGCNGMERCYIELNWTACNEVDVGCPIQYNPFTLPTFTILLYEMYHLFLKLRKTYKAKPKVLSLKYV